MNYNRVTRAFGPSIVGDRCPKCDRPAEKKKRVYECPRCGEVKRRFPDERA